MLKLLKRPSIQKLAGISRLSAIQPAGLSRVYFWIYYYSSQLLLSFDLILPEVVSPFRKISPFHVRQTPPVRLFPPITRYYLFTTLN